MIHKVPTAEIEGEPAIRGGFFKNPAQVYMAGVQKMPPESDRHPSPSDPADQGRVLLRGQKVWPLKLSSFSHVLARASFGQEAMSPIDCNWLKPLQGRLETWVGSNI